jgi:hypothetical protein
MATKTIWISYDLGVRGDYESLYSWLDKYGAKECGDSLAVLKYKYQGPLRETLKAELGKSFASDNRTRIYVIYHDDKSNTNKGTFLFGGRRAPAWSGYSPDGADTTDED